MAKGQGRLRGRPRKKPIAAFGSLVGVRLPPVERAVKNRVQTLVQVMKPNNGMSMSSCRIAGQLEGRDMTTTKVNGANRTMNQSNPVTQTTNGICHVTPVGRAREPPKKLVQEWQSRGVVQDFTLGGQATATSDVPGTFVAQQESQQVSVPQYHHNVHTQKSRIATVMKSSGEQSAALPEQQSPIFNAENFLALPVLSEKNKKGATQKRQVGDKKVSVEIVPKDVLLQYFGSVDIAPAPSLPIGIHRERVEESLAKGIPTSKEEFHALRASLFRLSKETNDSPVLATSYNDMALALNDLFSLHKMAKYSHDEAVTALQHLGSLREWLAQLENEWTVWKNRLTQATTALHASFFEVASEGTYSSVMATPLPVDPVAQLSTDILMDLQSEGITTSGTQEVLPAA
ncbi:hypothetical protein RND71_030705 [Anisodus tanguticus]|uniref:Uncharacterized protein n=1 Tax=Anisodus tanguticus TaxID=243964 RepID=A0AAE1RIP7_9SOLA|nr:hypothetical protein RND71_030705 [Anisodus tanguticus]